MTYTPEHLERWTSQDPAFGSTDNYIGADLSDFYLAPVSVTRDTADSLSLSNWQVVTEELEKLARHDETGIARMGHWACGWYEIFLIHATDSEALKAADQWAADLESYPVADESHLSELESQEEDEAWERYGESEWRDAIAKQLEQYAPDSADQYWASELAETLTDEQLSASWSAACEADGWHCEHHSDGPCLNIHDAAETLTAGTLSELLGQTILPADQRWRCEPYPWTGAAPAPLLA
jgi:hypothetical protein